MISADAVKTKLLIAQISYAIVHTQNYNYCQVLRQHKCTQLQHLCSQIKQTSSVRMQCSSQTVNKMKNYSITRTK